MKTYGKVHSSVRPSDIEITETSVFVANNITPYSEQIDGYTYSGFEYDCTEYSKDEYLFSQTSKIAQLE